MAKLPSVTAKELISALESIGFQTVRQKGSHVRMHHTDGRTVTIPVHTRQVIGKGLLLKILRDAELTKEELIELLQ
ncbi:addiction module toxin, HicA family [Synechococcales cyanobacterium C]|uniref:Addiction module toxin, HicA family n=1 Tax=Petrachloros mirabilis ULC683 TaxID=2781853 RepID=A0A8K1ZY76_9CYAN|nr:type II toxin-antitoxin system HicA family toxin [Petrachloros mirabilis]NCJ06327.1 addiction module toxin, HicA family [Petrachloros mirabilis ULC683]